MSIGTTLSDVLMCNTADVGVITTNFKENPLIPWSDIKISDITKIGTLLFKKGVAFSH
jgi:soluble P-type ATPase